VGIVLPWLGADLIEDEAGIGAGIANDFDAEDGEAFKSEGAVG